MITRDQFRLQVDRLCDTFGDRHFPDQRTGMIWDYVSYLEYPTVIAIVDSFIAESKFAPLPIDFKHAVAEATKGTEKRRYALGDIQPREIANCQDCCDSGFVRLARNAEFEEWAKWERGSAPCHCSRGKELADKLRAKPKNSVDLGPQFNDNWLKSYSINREPG